MHCRVTALYVTLIIESFIDVDPSRGGSAAGAAYTVVQCPFVL